jgi:hypothetical protein
MLAQNFKSAADLGITEPQFDALRKTLVLLETGKLRHFDINQVPDADFPDLGFSGDFNMGTFGLPHDCGTAACIAGTAQLIADVRFVGVERTPELSELFYIDSLVNTTLENITPAQAATALRSYLTTGDARWDLAVS